MSGYSTFTRDDALAELSLTPEAFTAALTRQISRKKLANPRHGFYIILRPEDRIAGAPDPARWIDPLRKYLATDYRISHLRAAAMHGSSHQAAMVFQVVVPQQFRSIVIGRHRIQFIYLAPLRPFFGTKASGRNRISRWHCHQQTAFQTAFALFRRYRPRSNHSRAHRTAIAIRDALS